MENITNNLFFIAIDFEKRKELLIEIYDYVFGYNLVILFGAPGIGK